MGVDSKMGVIERDAIEHRFQRFGRGGQSVAEGVRRSFENERKAGGSLGQIFASLRVCAHRIGIVGTLHHDPRRVGPPARQWRGLYVSFLERVDSDSVIGPRSQRIFECASRQCLFSKRHPFLPVRCREIEIVKRSSGTHPHPRCRPFHRPRWTLKRPLGSRNALRQQRSRFRWLQCHFQALPL